MGSTMKWVQHDRGFTVVELLIALSIVSTLMLMLIGGIDYARRYFERAAMALRNTDEITLLHGLLREALSQVVTDPRSPGLAGTERELGVRSAASRVPPMAGPIWFSIKADGPKGVVASWQPLLTRDEPVTHQLAPPETQLRFAYAAAQGGWSDVWNDTARLPARIRATLTSDSDAVLDFVVPVRAVPLPACATGDAPPRLCGERQ